MHQSGGNEKELMSGVRTSSPLSSASIDSSSSDLSPFPDKSFLNTTTRHINHQYLINNIFHGTVSFENLAIQAENFVKESFC